MNKYEEEEDDEKDICDYCNGSGEGMYDGSTCFSCGGSGAKERAYERGYFDEPEINYDR